MKRKVVLIILVILVNVLWINAINITNSFVSRNNIVINTGTKNNNNKNPNIMDDIDVLLRTDLVYGGENADLIAKKINNAFGSDMKDYGNLISKYSIANGVNPYLVASMIIVETGCDNKCSVLVKKCNNVYEAVYDKESINQASCFGGDYQKFASIDDSIKSFIKYIKFNFYDNELTTPNSIYKSFKKDVRWAFLVNFNMEKIKNSN